MQLGLSMPANRVTAVCPHRGKSANNLSADASEIGLGLLLCRIVVLEFRLVVYPSSFG